MTASTSKRGQICPKIFHSSRSLQRHTAHEALASLTRWRSTGGASVEEDADRGVLLLDGIAPKCGPGLELSSIVVEKWRSIGGVGVKCLLRTYTSDRFTLTSEANRAKFRAGLKLGLAYGLSGFAAFGQLYARVRVRAKTLYLILV